MSLNRRDWQFLALLAACTLFELATIYYTPLDLAPDEAHYWYWSKRLDSSYYSKGPVVAWLIWVGTALFGDTAFAVRAPALLCLTAASLLAYECLRRLHGSEVALTVWIAFRAMLLFAYSGFAMTTDAPSLLCWTAALVCAVSALRSTAFYWWPLCGAACCLGILTKYTLLALPAGILLALAAIPEYRAQLKRSSFWTGMAIASSSAAVLLSWNAAHEWVNLKHNSGHATGDHGIALRPQFVLEIIGAQLGLVGPLLLWLLIAAALSALRGRITPRAKFLALSSVPLAAGVLAVACTKRVYANWPLPLYAGLLFALAEVLALRSSPLLSPQHERIIRWIRPAIALSACMTVAAHLPILGFSLGIPANLLPSKRLAGWAELGSVVNAALQQYQPQDPFLLTDAYTTAAEISFYASAHPFVYLANLDDRRMTQYDIWTQTEDWNALKNRSAIIALKSPEAAEQLRPAFASLTPLEPPSFTVQYAGQIVRSTYLFFGVGFSGSPTPRPLHY